ncbi:CU044_5270 family protein [Spirillospora sp. NPDC052269]
MNELDMTGGGRDAGELDALRDLRADIPPMDQSVRNDIRANLFTLTDDAPMPKRAPRARKERRAVLPIAAAVLLTVGIGVGVAVVRDTGGASSGVQSGTDPRVGPHKWIYTRSLFASGGSMSTWYKGVNPSALSRQEDWRRVDGEGKAFYNRSGKLSFFWTTAGVSHKGRATLIYAGGGPLYSFANYDRLPTDTEALLHRLTTDRYRNQVGPTNPVDAFDRVEDMLQDPLPPRLAKALYRVLHRIPGVVVRPRLTDAAGRRGDGFSFTDGGDRKTVIIDPVSFRLMGTSEDAVTDFRNAGDLVRKGTLLERSAVIECKIVNKAGQR